MDAETKLVSVDEVVPVDEIARIYGVSNRTVYRWKHSKRVPFLKISPGCLRFDPKAVRQALESRSAAEVSTNE